jgi:hypothetical protein
VKARADGVVVEGVLREELLGVRGREQCVVAVGKAIDHDVLTRQRLVVEIGPSRGDALVGVAVGELLGGARARIDPLAVLQAKRLLRTGPGRVARRVGEEELVEVDEVVVTMTCGKDEPVRVIGWVTDRQVGVSLVVREEVEAHHPVRAWGDAAVGDVVGVGEALGVDREVPNDGNEIDAHGDPPT